MPNRSKFDHVSCAWTLPYDFVQHLFATSPTRAPMPVIPACGCFIAPREVGHAPHFECSFVYFGLQLQRLMRK